MNLDPDKRKEILRLHNLELDPGQIAAQAEVSRSTVDRVLAAERTAKGAAPEPGVETGPRGRPPRRRRARRVQAASRRAGNMLPGGASVELVFDLVRSGILDPDTPGLITERGRRVLELLRDLEAA